MRLGTQREFSGSIAVLFSETKASRVWIYAVSGKRRVETLVDGRWIAGRPKVRKVDPKVCPKCSAERGKRPDGRYICRPCDAAYQRTRKAAQRAARKAGVSITTTRIDYHPIVDEPSEPTTAVQGTQAKVEVLAERVARREPLWHPEDVTAYA